MNGARSTTTGTSDATLNANKPTSLALRPKDAARALGIGQRKLWEMTKAGVIPSIKLGTCTLYPVHLLQAWLAEQAAKGGRTQ